MRLNQKKVENQEKKKNKIWEVINKIKEKKDNNFYINIWILKIKNQNL